ncbi:PilZ domain-containing protein [Lachnotalea glycerini]|nr:PilZ domain-containing protein [Lachnotalea glycerini]PXV95391.1 PilZ domain-containing protein [Lachnotalea glycerini]
MSEKRKYKRSDLKVTIHLRRCDSTEHNRFLVDVQDLSREGLGFYSNEDLKIGQYFDTEIVIWTKEVIKVVLRIVRKTEQPDKEKMSYGGEFIGLSEAEKFRIDVYQCVEENLEKGQA